MNTACFTGNLTADPELRSTGGGKSVCELRVAINIAKDKAVFVTVTVWDAQADNCANYLHKGSKVAVTGYLDQDEWQDKQTGQKRSKIKITANRVDFMDPASDTHSRSPHPRQSAPPRQEYEPSRTAHHDEEDDIPF